ncbi:MAG: glycosyltransferase family 4 protein [Elusimicrobiaceae bacterium]
MAEKLKTFHLITKLELGGAQGNTLHTVRNLNKERYGAVLLTGKGGILDKEAGNALFLRFLKREVNPLSDFLALIELWHIFRREKPDILHTHSSKAGILGRLAGRLAGVPVIVHTFHGFGFNGTQPKLVEKFYHALERALASCADKLVFVSETNRELARELHIGSPDQYELIRSGIKLSEYPARNADAAALRAELGLPERGPVVVTVGNLKPQKNPLDFVRTAQEVLKACPDAVFLYLGDGPLRAETEKLARELGVADRCFFPGWRRDVPQIMAVSSVFILTSLWEGLPRSLVQAIRSGLPCSVYITDGVTDIIDNGRNGFLIPSRDTKRMAETVISLLKNASLRAKIAGTAAKTDLADFDIDAMVRRQEELYERIIKVKGK